MTSSKISRTDIRICQVMQDLTENQRYGLMYHSEYQPAIEKWIDWKSSFGRELNKIITNSKMKDKAEIMVCKCSSTEHQVVYYHDQSDNEVYMHVHLSGWPWWKRVWPAVKYLFGHRSRYGNWDEFILGPEHVGQLRELADRIEECERERLRRHAEQW
jgi:hypothetical protein